MERQELEKLIEQSNCYTKYICPRCGSELKETMVKNALSRHANAFICSSCGTDEALRDVFEALMSYDEWFICNQINNKI